MRASLQRIDAALVRRFPYLWACRPLQFVAAVLTSTLLAIVATALPARSAWDDVGLRRDALIAVSLAMVLLAVWLVLCAVVQRSLPLKYRVPWFWSAGLVSALVTASALLPAYSTITVAEMQIRALRSIDQVRDDATSIGILEQDGAIGRIGPSEEALCTRIAVSRSRDALTETARRYTAPEKLNGLERNLKALGSRCDGQPLRYEERLAIADGFTGIAAKIRAVAEVYGLMESAPSESLLVSLLVYAAVLSFALTTLLVLSRTLRLRELSIAATSIVVTYLALQVAVTGPRLGYTPLSHYLPITLLAVGAMGCVVFAVWAIGALRRSPWIDVAFGIAMLCSPLALTFILDRRSESGLGPFLWPTLSSGRVYWRDTDGQSTPMAALAVVGISWIVSFATGAVAERYRRLPD